MRDSVGKWGVAVGLGLGAFCIVGLLNVVIFTRLQDLERIRDIESTLDATTVSIEELRGEALTNRREIESTLALLVEIRAAQDERVRTSVETMTMVGRRFDSIDEAVRSLSMMAGRVAEDVSDIEDAVEDAVEDGKVDDDG